MAISSSIFKAASASIDLLFSDSNLTVQIQYKLFSGSTFNEGLGYNQDVYINYSLVAIKTERKRISVASSGQMGGIEGTEISYLIKDLPEDYSNRDILEHDGVNHQIEKITPIADMAFRIEIKGV